VVRSGDRVRVTAQLIYAPRDSNLWAQTYDRDLSEVLTLQSSVATAIAEEIQVKMTPGEKLQLKSVRQVNREALDAYLDGRYHVDRACLLQLRRGFEKEFEGEARKAVADFDRAAQADPSYVSSYLGVLELNGCLFHTPPALNLSVRARAGVAKALQTDDSFAQAHLENARMLMADWDWPAAEKEYKRAIELNPNFADAHAFYADYLDLMAGDHGRAAQKERELAQQLDPKHDRFGPASLPLDSPLDQQREYVDEREPNNFLLRALLGKNYQQAGKYKEAVEQYMKLTKLLGYPERTKILQRGYARGNYKGAIRDWMKAYLTPSKGQDLPRFFAAWLYANLGDNDQAFTLLEEAYQQHDGVVVYLKSDPIWDPIRSDPRFKELIRRVGLPP